MLGDPGFGCHILNQRILNDVAVGTMNKYVRVYLPFLISAITKYGKEKRGRG